MALKLIKNLDGDEMVAVYFVFCMNEAPLDFISPQNCEEFSNFVSKLRIYGGHFFINTEYVHTEDYGMIKPYHMVVDSFAASKYDTEILIPTQFIHFTDDNKSILHWDNSYPYSLN